jgi:hypothetical protein
VHFVAPNGSDSNPGTLFLPYLSIQKCAITAASGETCAVRAGTYRETVTPNSGVTITSYDSESVTADGSDPVTAWTLFQGSIYKATATLGTGDTNQIFVGNQMMTEARWPNGDDLFNVNWASAQAGTTVSKIVDANLPHINWTGAKIHTWSGTDPWNAQTGTITESQIGELTISLDSVCYQAFICPRPAVTIMSSAVLAHLMFSENGFMTTPARLCISGPQTTRTQIHWMCAPNSASSRLT